MASDENGSVSGIGLTRISGIVALVALFALALSVSRASADSFSMTFTEARANVGAQLSDAALFEAPDTAPLEAQIDPGTGSVTAGLLPVPQFATHITEPIDADVTVDFQIGTITGSFDQATGALTLEGEAGGTLTSEGKECTVSTTPGVLTLSTAGSSGGAAPRSGAPFNAGITGPGAIAGQWTDMQAAPVGGDASFCSDVESRIEGPGGVWLEQEGDVVSPSAPQLTGTEPGSPDASGNPRIQGTAEAGSTVRVYNGPSCAGVPVATAGAAQLASPGIVVQVAQGSTAVFSATATDAAGNTSACSVPISYTRLKNAEPPPSGCIVPKLRGKTLPRAKAALRAAGCKIGNVRKPKRPNRRGRVLVVKSSSPSAGARSATGKVNVRLGPKPRNGRQNP